MLHFMKPLFVSLIGLALLIYGTIHAFLHNPGLGGFAALWASLPAVSSILVFGLGILAALGGLILLVGGFRGLYRRYLQIRHAFGPRQRHMGYADDGD